MHLGERAAPPVVADPVAGYDAAAALCGCRDHGPRDRRVTDEQPGRLARECRQRLLVRGRREDVLDAEPVED
jgi:hypothetical protein